MQISLREVTTAAALEEKQKLQKGLGYIDMIFFTAAALIGLDTLGAFSANGGQALTWLLFSAITCTLVMKQLPLAPSSPSLSGLMHPKATLASVVLITLLSSSMTTTAS